MYKVSGTLEGCDINIPDSTSINEYDSNTITTTNWSMPTVITPEVKVLKTKSKLLFYYWNEKTLHYAIYEDGKPIAFKPTDDFLEVLAEVGVFE